MTMGAVQIARISHRVYKNVGGSIAQVFKNINRIIYSCDIAYQVDIPSSTIMPHQGLGVVMHPKTTIGENCVIFHNTTFGSKHGLNSKDVAPILGNNVIVGVGAVVLGNITIGNNVSIGANSVVVDDIPDNAVVAGKPAQILYFKETNK